MSTETATDFKVMDVRSPEPYRDVIIEAITAINAKSVGHYPPEVIYEHLRTRLRTYQHRVTGKSMSALWIFFKGDEVCGLITLDEFEDEIGIPMANISRAWARPGHGREIWLNVYPFILNWAKERGCHTIAGQSQRHAAWARWLELDGFKMMETTFVKDIFMKEVQS